VPEKRPPATRTDHETFCTTEGWTERKPATGKRGTHHVNFELPLPDGRILYTRISHPVDRTDYGPIIWSHILRDQLAVSEAEFWACVRDADKPLRGGLAPPALALPAELAYLLLHRVGISEDEVAGMSREQAIERLNAYWTTG
jgi:hypothetical protein